MKKTLRVGGKIILTVFLLSGCIFIFRSNSIKTEAPARKVNSPIKVHLNDGRTIMFRSGANFTEDQIEGDGMLYSLTLEAEKKISGIQRDEVAAYEVFSSEVNYAPTFLVSTAATVVGTVGSLAIFKAIFGSCPTIYSETDSTMVLESELFSNSIAPLLEKRDIAGVRAQPDEEGTLQLEVRNEALETHYINHLELIEVNHSANQKIFPTNKGTILAMDKFTDPISARNSRGRDLGKILRERDSLSYDFDIPEADSSSPVKWDHIELVFPPSEDDTAALYLDLRNSLFSTILLYEYLLASQGVESLEWIGTKLNTVSGAVALGDFHHTYMGLRIEQKIGNEYQQVNRISNTGPIAWREVAVPVTTIPGDSLRLRLIFLADSWRINQIKLATHVEIPEIRYLPVSKIQNPQGELTPDKVDLVSRGDDQYIVTYPGDHFTISFETGSEPKDKQTSYLLAGQGYYIEWIRNSWLEENGISELDFSGNIIYQAQQRWQETKEDFEQQFFNSRVPIQ